MLLLFVSLNVLDEAALEAEDDDDVIHLLPEAEARSRSIVGGYVVHVSLCAVLAQYCTACSSSNQSSTKSHLK